MKHNYGICRMKCVQFFTCKVYDTQIEKGIFTNSIFLSSSRLSSKAVKLQSGKHAYWHRYWLVSGKQLQSCQWEQFIVCIIFISLLWINTLPTLSRIQQVLCCHLSKTAFQKKTKQKNKVQPQFTASGFAILLRRPRECLLLLFCFQLSAWARISTSRGKKDQPPPWSTKRWDQ